MEYTMGKVKKWIKDLIKGTAPYPIPNECPVECIDCPFYAAHGDCRAFDLIVTYTAGNEVEGVPQNTWLGSKFKGDKLTIFSVDCRRVNTPVQTNVCIYYPAKRDENNNVVSLAEVVN